MNSLPSATVADADLSGRKLGGYRVVRRLGSGAMADVYLAEQESLSRQVAVKVLRGETLLHPTAVQRFAQEARAAAALVHGNIVQIHEVACIDGIHFLAEEYVAGPTLKLWLAKRGPLTAQQALAVLAQVGSALVRAAQQGVVHRDIKPENLLVSPAGEVKVADFGLARLLDSTGGLDLTQHGTALGTPLYMSPEQAEGGAVDTRSDLYSLGATVYHLLAGRPPFAGATSVAVAIAHVQEPLVPIGRLRPDLPPALDAILDRLLAKSPADRFQSPTELLQAVEAAEASFAPTSRHLPSPLCWEGEAFDGEAGEPSPEQPTVAPRVYARTIEVRDATERLQAAIEREQLQREASRRFWLATAGMSLVSLLAGWAVGRSRSRRSSLFRSQR